MLVEIVTPDKKVFEGEVYGVNMPGTDGSFELLNNHAPIISTLGLGFVKVRMNEGNDQIFEIDGGVAEMMNNKLIILAEKVVA